MKAAIIEKPNQLTIKEITPPPLGEYDVLCETQYGAMCTGTDTHLLHHHSPFCNWIDLPAILGHESIGKVVELGSKVKSFKIGDMVTRVGHPGNNEVSSAWGGFSELSIGKDWKAMKKNGLPESEWRAYTINQVLPQEVDPAYGTMFITWRETLSYMNRIGAKQALSALIIGSGSNGLSIANHAINLGIHNVVLMGSSSRISQAHKVGCHTFIDYKDHDAKNKLKAIEKNGFDLVIDVIGTPKTSSLGLSSIANNGTLGVYGLDDINSISLSPSLAAGKTFTIYQNGYDEGEAHQEVCDFVSNGKLDASIWIDKEKSIDLNNINDGFKAIEDRSLVKPLIKIKS